MSRRNKAQKRVIFPDPRYGSVLVTTLVGSVIKKGKKSIAEKIVYSALEAMDKKIGDQIPAMEKFEQAMNNIRPGLEVKSRRVGGATYQVPIEVAPDRSRALSLRWLLEAARKRNEHDMSQRLAAELVQAYSSEGNAVKKKVDTHRMADANKAFAHFRW